MQILQLFRIMNGISLPRSFTKNGMINEYLPRDGVVGTISVLVDAEAFFYA